MRFARKWFKSLHIIHSHNLCNLIVWVNCDAWQCGWVSRGTLKIKGYKDWRILVNVRKKPWALKSTNHRRYLSGRMYEHLLTHSARVWTRSRDTAFKKGGKMGSPHLCGPRIRLMVREAWHFQCRHAKKTVVITLSSWTRTVLITGVGECFSKVDIRRTSRLSSLGSSSRTRLFIRLFARAVRPRRRMKTQRLDVKLRRAASSSKSLHIIH